MSRFHYFYLHYIHIYIIGNVLASESNLTMSHLTSLRSPERLLKYLRTTNNTTKWIQDHSWEDLNKSHLYCSVSETVKSNHQQSIVRRV